MAYQQHPQGTPGSAYPNYYPNYPPHPGFAGQFGFQGHGATTPGVYPPGYPGVSSAGTPTGYVPPPQFTGFYMDDYGAGDGDEDDDENEDDVYDDSRDSEEVVQMTEEVAERVLKNVTCQILRQEGFDIAARHTVGTLVHELVAHMENLYRAAKDYSDHVNNPSPSLYDFLAAFEENGVTADNLSPKKPPGLMTPKLRPEVVKRRARKRKRTEFEPIYFGTGDISDPEPMFDADEVAHVPPTFRINPMQIQLPPFPPKHTYIRTPPSPPQRSTLNVSLDKKLQNTAMVRKALKNLMDATDTPEVTSEEQDDEPVVESPTRMLSTSHPTPIATPAPIVSTPMEIDSSETPGPKEDVPASKQQPNATALSKHLRKYNLKQANLVNWQESFSMNRKRWTVTR